MESSIYVGTLRHRRSSPVRHEFTYPLFMVFLDIDEIPKLMQVSPFTGYNRWSWASYHERDHFGDPARTLRQRILQAAKQKTVEIPGGRIFLLTHLRYLGYNFNPVSFFYCYDRAETLKLILAEVSNTFGETENYWLDSSLSQSEGNSMKFRFPKTFHVSPFMNMSQEYEWTFTNPAERLINQCVSHENGQAIFDSTLKMDRRDWSREQLQRTLIQYPWMTLKVISGIHWEALKLAIKGVPVVHHPGPGRFDKAPTQHWGASW